MNAPCRRHAAALMKWAVPGTVLVLMPKCPVCLAMDAALLGGFGLSVARASFLRTSVILLCASALAYLAIRSARILPKHKTPRNRSLRGP